MRTIHDIRQQALTELDNMLSRPGMWVTCAADQEALYLRQLELLCFIDERDDALTDQRQHLKAVGAHYPSNLVNGVSNALRLVMPDVPSFEAETGSVYAEVAYRLGYLKTDRTLTEPEFKAVEDSLYESDFDRDWSREDVLAAFGEPSFVVEPKRVFCYAAEDREVPWTFMDIPEEAEGCVRSVRCYRQSLDAGLRLTPRGRELTTRGEAQPAYVLPSEWRRAHLRVVDDDD